jgi:hypothetical protein
MDGFANVLAMRARHLGVPVKPAEAYIDREPYPKALGQLS